MNLVAQALGSFNADTEIEEVRTGIIDFFANAEAAPGITKTYTFGETGEIEVDPLEDV